MGASSGAATEKGPTLLCRTHSTTSSTQRRIVIRKKSIQALATAAAASQCPKIGKKVYLGEVFITSLKINSLNKLF